MFSWRQDHDEEFVCIYDLLLHDYWRFPQTPSGDPMILRDENQVAISGIEWQPMSPNTLAVSCSAGICIWTVTRGATDCAGIAPIELVQHEGGKPAFEMGARSEALPRGMHKHDFSEVPAWVSSLSHPSHNPAGSSTVAWSPDGQMVAVGCAAESNIIVWDVGTEVPTSIKATPAGVTSLAWSPSGNYLLAATTAASVILWETQTWNHREWTGLAAPCRSACWGKGERAGSEVALFHTWGGKTIHALQTQSYPPSIEASHYRIQDTSAYEVKVPVNRGTGGRRDVKNVRVMGTISQLSWDRQCKRLVVSFEEDDASEPGGIGGPAHMANAIALYTVDLQRHPVRLEPRGFLVGPENMGGVSQLSFANNFSRGALVSACWRNGEVSLFPLYD